MNYREKRKTKRRAIYGHVLAFVFMGLLIACVVLYTALNFETPNTTAISNALIGYCALLFLVGVIGFLIMGTYNSIKLDRYRRKIYYWRQYTFFNKCLNGLLKGNLEQAVEYHSDQLLKDEYLRNFLWGFGIHTFLTSDDDKKKEFAEQVITNMKKDFNPESVFN